MKVLVVDDSATERRILERVVSKLGHDCVVAGDGETGWNLFRDEGADVVISDWLMPGMEGDELCRRIRAAGPPYSYIIILTGFEDRKHLLGGMNAGADDYLTKPLDVDDLEASLTAAARVTRLHRKLDQQQAQLEDLNAQLAEQARRDPLTGVGNRLRMGEDLETLEGRAARYGHKYAALLCDVDHFKLYNDVCGHVAGDAVLRSVAGALVDTARSGDAVYRYGGEEMLVLLPEQNLDSARAAGELAREAVEGLSVPHPGIGPDAVVTISVGVAVRRPEALRPDDVLRRADEALYLAKRSGRNQVRAETDEKLSKKPAGSPRA